MSAGIKISVYILLFFNFHTIVLIKRILWKCVLLFEFNKSTYMVSTKRVNFFLTTNNQICISLWNITFVFKPKSRPCDKFIFLYFYIKFIATKCFRSITKRPALFDLVKLRGCKTLWGCVRLWTNRYICIRTMKQSSEWPTTVKTNTFDNEDQFAKNCQNLFQWVVYKNTQISVYKHTYIAYLFGKLFFAIVRLFVNIFQNVHPISH